VDLGLKDRVAIVTGGSQGIGRSIARRLADEGAQVVLCARRPAGLDATVDEITASGGTALAIVADVTNAVDCTAVVERTLERFDRVDVLVNNVGKGSPKPLLDLTDDDWRQSLELNLLGAVRLSSRCLPHMRRNHWGRIVNISSRVGREPDPYFAPYAAAKAALINYSKSLANAFSGENVLTNCIVPGLIRSEAFDQAAQNSAEATAQTVESVMAEMLRRRPIPAGRLGEPDDVAGLVAFLASDLASWITGACISVDGGMVRSAP
jgi:3-oxoacyl-[acyl-carrier protein] reductase